MVSIHAPTRGATHKGVSKFVGCIVSIHAPTRGATFVILYCSLDFSFNPRTHEGCDLYPAIKVCAALLFQSTHPRGVRLADPSQYIFTDIVSIHAPTRGATPGITTQKSYDKGFNPRTHEGCDQQMEIAIALSDSFNPRTHEGCDP